ncbi:Ni/Fe hydrogenase subunit alpha [Candidatus Acetothermia bacterium]|nr:Ni/Fe hydrogenase subunit alpha [Candidatus Acetothermia bacterium]MBI3644299.1 Ni/Fe hydrogenase subunit alpha [Candidatus Acetothermia bacterium]
MSSPKKSKTRTIKVDYLARVEGEGAMFIKLAGGEVKEVRLEIFEPPRFFEAFLRGRNFTEAPDITARICGICPIAYQMSSINAMEDLCGVSIGGQLRELRRLIYCGEWIQSHVLHAFMLHLPDFLGYQDAIQMAGDHPDLVKKALRMKKLGNEIMNIVGGRAVHPINMRVGGFYRVPTRDELLTLNDELSWAIGVAEELVHFTGELKFLDFEQDYEFVAMRHPDEYAIIDGRLISNRGLDISVREFDEHIQEEHVRHSTALHARIKARGNYFVGPLARFNLNFEQLSPRAQAAAKRSGLGKRCNNPFKSIIVRSVEILYALELAQEIIGKYKMPERPYVEVKPKAGTGYGCSEAPRGICHHRYTIDEEGTIMDARIAPPTSQNQKTIESDLANFVRARIELPHDELQWQCEQAIRNYDPCISCSTHFLRLHIEQE